MERPLILIAAASLITLSLACRVTGTPAPTSTPLPSETATFTLSPAPTATATSTLTPTSTHLPTATLIVTLSGPCELTSTSSLTVYQRPSTAAAVFGTLPAGMPVGILGLTADDWLGFEPDVAQAANIGVFRLRWIEPGSPVDLTGDCHVVPVVVGPPPGVCITMPMGDVNVYQDRDTASPLVGVLVIGDYAAVTARSADNDWAQLDLDLGENGLSGTGWMESFNLNLNGPCDSLPILP